jgi:hypothetical protein
MMPIKSMFFLFVIIVCLVLLASYAFTGSFEFYRSVELAMKTGSLSIGGVTPRVELILMNDTPTAFQSCTYLPTNCQFNGQQGTTRAIGVRAIIEDDNGNCDSWAGGNVMAYVCQGLVASCNAVNRDYPVTLGSPVKFTYSGCTNCYCNYTGTFSVQYWKRWENWTINVTATDDTSKFNQTNRTWFYIQLNSLAYPWTATGIGGAIPLGEVTMGYWNFSKGENITRNWGNIRLNITFNATDFKWNGVGPDFIEVHYNNFTVANMSGNPFSNPPNYENMSSSETLEAEFHPDNGIHRCGSDTCNQDEEFHTLSANLANYTLWWNIFTPTGIAGGTYTNSIYVNSYVMTGTGY